MHYRIFFGLTITFYVYYVILFISIEPDWCANYDKEKDNYEKIQLLTKQKQYRQTIIERLRKIRIQEEEQERHEEEELMRKRLHDDNSYSLSSVISSLPVSSLCILLLSSCNRFLINSSSS